MKYICTEKSCHNDECYHYKPHEPTLVDDLMCTEVSLCIRDDDACRVKCEPVVMAKGRDA